MNDKYKTLSILLFGMVVGMGYMAACGSERDGGSTASGAAGAPGTMTPGMMNLPGVSMAMAQGTGTAACAQWELIRINPAPDTGEVINGNAVKAPPPGWLPIEATLFIRCAQ